MKRSDLKKILMEEVLSILSEKMSEEDRCEKIMAMTMQQIADNMLEDEWRECRKNVDLTQRIKDKIDDSKPEEPPATSSPEEGPTGTPPESITDRPDPRSAGKAKPTGVAPGERPTKVQPTEKPADAAAEEEDEDAIYGLTSKKNPESLLNILSKAGFEGEVIQKVVAKMIQLADDDNIVLEAVSLRGRGSEQDRVMNSESVGELISLVRSLGLDADQNRAMMKALNNWGNRNTVRFEKPTYAPAAQPAPEKPAAGPEKEEPRAAGGLTDDPPAYTTAEDPAQTGDFDVGELGLSSDPPSEEDQTNIAYSGLDAYEKRAKEEEEEAITNVDSTMRSKGRLSTVSLFANHEERLGDMIRNYRNRGGKQWLEDLDAWFKLASDAGLDIGALPNESTANLVPIFKTLVKSPKYRKLIYKKGDPQAERASRIQMALFRPRPVHGGTENQWNFEFVKDLLSAVKGPPPRPRAEFPWDRDTTLQEQKTINRWKLLAGIQE